MASTIGSAVPRDPRDGQARPAVRCGRVAVLLLFALTFFLTTCRAALVLNEVMYDPDGADRGFEWVEIANSAVWEISLEDLLLESRDESGDWRTLWRGAQGSVVPPSGFVTIGGAYAARPADYSAALSMRNDGLALRIRKVNLVLDTVAWGDAVATDEGAPAAKVRAGHSLARRQDGADSDRNEGDFEEAAPTPGRANRPARDLAVTIRRPGRALPIGPSTLALDLRLRVENRGRERADAVRVVLSDSSRVLDPPQLPALEPGTSVELPLLAETSGPWLAARLDYEGDLVPENDADTLRYVRDSASIRLNELMARPDTSGAEWIELVARGGASTLDWAIEDASGTRATLLERGLPSGAVMIVRADMKGTVWQGDWPSLNDFAGKDGAADSLFLFDPAGRLVDWAAWGSGPRGRSWTRDRSSPSEAGLAAWRNSEPSPGVDGSSSRILPSDPKRVLTGAALSLVRHPDGAWLKLDASLFPGSYAVRVVSLDGRVVYEGQGASRDRSDQWLRWNGHDRRGAPCATGVYVVDLDARPVGSDARRERATVVLDR